MDRWKRRLGLIWANATLYIQALHRLAMCENGFHSHDFVHIAIPVMGIQSHAHMFYRASICQGGLGSRNSVSLSVCLSVRLFVCHTRGL